MTLVQISVRKEVYDKLKKAKKADESFSDLIERLVGTGSNVQAFLNCQGIAKDPDEGLFYEAFREGQRQIRENLFR